MQSEIRISARTGPERPLGTLMEDVLRSAQDVVEHQAELLRLEAQEGVRRGAVAIALVLAGSTFVGILAAAFWIAGMAGVAWLGSERPGLPTTLAALWSLHVALALGAGLALRGRFARGAEERE